MRLTASLATLLLIAAALPAAAQEPKQLSRPGKPFQHKHSKLELPAKLDGLPLVASREAVPDQLDVIVNYEAGEEAISIYIYRLASGAVPVWFDAARYSIEHRTNLYGKPVAPAPAAAFTPPGQSTASGLAIAYAPSIGPFKSTGLMLMPLGEWLVKIRYSSRQHEAAALASRMQALLAELRWPRNRPAAPAATEVQLCPDGLQFTGRSKDAAPDKSGMMTTLLAGALPSTASDAKAKPEPGPAITWCRDPAPLEFGMIYRADAARDSYLLVASDAGRAISITPDVIGRELAASRLKESKDPAAVPAPDTWSVRYVELTRTINFLAQDRMPAPAQAIEIVQSGRFASSVTTWGKKREISLNSEMLK